MEAEIFIPAAASRLIHKEHLKGLIDKGLEMISCGANVPFADNEIFFGSIAEYADSHVTVIPDFIANCGMARVFRYLMGDQVEISDNAIFSDVSSCIGGALKEVHTRHPESVRLSQAALEWSIEKLI